MIMIALSSCWLDFSQISSEEWQVALRRTRMKMRARRSKVGGVDAQVMQTYCLITVNCWV